MGPSLGLFMEEESCPICLTMCVLFLLFFLGEEGPCVSLLGHFFGGRVCEGEEGLELRTLLCAFVWVVYYLRFFL